MRARRAIAIAAACSLASCSLVTSWNGLTKKNEGGSSSTSGTSTSGTSTSATSQSSSSGGQCVLNGLYCGNDKLPGDPTRLYQCKADGMGNLVEVCMYGCTLRAAGHDDNCHCVPNALYCGNDKIDGDINTLYKCQPGTTMPTIVMKCPTKCVINTSANDSCT